MAADHFEFIEEV